MNYTRRTSLAGQMRGRMETLIAWNPPLLGWVKLNSNEVAKGNSGIVGSGDIFRDWNDNFLAAYALSIGNSTAIISEIQSVL